MLKQADHFTELVAKYVNAANDEQDSEYRITLEAIRNAISSCRNGVDLHKLEGAIIFYKLKQYNEDKTPIDSAEERMHMKVFVLGEEQLRNTLCKKAANTREISDVLEKIGALRKYNTLKHYSWFRKHYNSKEHYFVPIHAIESEDEGDHSTDGQIFTSELTDALIIPIPVLSSPSILVFLDLKKIKKDAYGVQGGMDDEKKLLLFVREIQRRAAEVINFHITRKLLNEFTSQKKSNSQYRKDFNEKHIEELTSVLELITKFADNLSNVLLPIEYTIKDEKGCVLKKQEVFDWFGKDYQTESFFDLDILGGKYSIRYSLPTFYVPYSSHGANGMIHLAPDYEIRKQQLKDELEDLFDLIYLLWNRIQEQEKIVKNAINEYINKSPTISPGIIDNLIKDNQKMADTLEGFKNELLAIQDIKIGERVDKEGFVRNADGSYTLTLEEEGRFNSYNIPYKSPGVGGMNYQDGMDALYAILKESTEKGVTEISCLNFLGMEESRDDSNTTRKKLVGANSRYEDGIIVTEGQDLLNKAIESVKIETYSFLRLVMTSYPEIYNEYKKDGINTDKRLLIRIFKVLKSNREMLEIIARLYKEKRTIKRKLSAGLFRYKEAADETIKFDQTCMIIDFWHQLFSFVYNTEYQLVCEAAQVEYTKELNTEKFSRRKPSTKKAGDVKKAICAALNKLNEITKTRKLINNLTASGFLNETKGNIIPSAIKANKHLFFYDNSNLSNADNINWHFS